MHKILSNFLLQFLFTVFNNRESKLKVVLLFRTFFEAFVYDKARYFCNVFDARTLLPSSYFWFYKFTSENVHHTLITPKTKFTSSSKWPK